MVSAVKIKFPSLIILAILVKNAENPHLHFFQIIVLFFIFIYLFIANKAAVPRGLCVSIEEKSHHSVRDLFWPYLGVSNTP